MPNYKQITKMYINMLNKEVKSNMKVKVFDEESEKDLEESVNNFLGEANHEIVDIKYQVSCSVYSEEQIYCFSAMIIYYTKI